MTATPTDPVLVQSVLLCGPCQQGEVDQPDEDHTGYHYWVREKRQEEGRISKGVHEVRRHEETTRKCRQVRALTMHYGWGGLGANLYRGFSLGF